MKREIKFLIFASILVVIISAVALLFFRELLKENTTTVETVEPKEKQQEAAKEEAVYGIPENPIPSPAALNAEIVKKKEAKKAVNEALKNAQSVRNVVNAQIRQEAEREDKALLASPEPRVPEVKSVSFKPESPEEARPAPAEAKKALKAKGLIAF